MTTNQTTTQTSGLAEELDARLAAGADAQELASAARVFLADELRTRAAVMRATRAPLAGTVEAVAEALEQGRWA